MVTRRHLATLAALAALTGCSETTPFEAASADTPATNRISAQAARAFPTSIDLPNGFSPEGIATGEGTTFYVGSLAGGAIYRGDLRTGDGSILVEPPGSVAAGLAFDRRTGFLFVTSDLEARVYDGYTGALAGTFAFPEPILTNDVIVTAGAAYFTDSRRAVLYRLPLGADGSLPAPSAMQVMPLSGDYVFYDNPPTPFGINNNGIVASPDGSTLLIANMADGVLYAVDAATGVASAVNIPGDPLVFSDGYVLNGMTLYASLGDRIAVIRLRDDYGAGELSGYITDSRFDFVSTVAMHGSNIYAVNARFATPPGPDVPYTVVSVPAH